MVSNVGALFPCFTKHASRHKVLIADKYLDLSPITALVTHHSTYHPSHPPQLVQWTADGKSPPPGVLALSMWLAALHGYLDPAPEDGLAAAPGPSYAAYMGQLPDPSAALYEPNSLRLLHQAHMLACGCSATQVADMPSVRCWPSVLTKKVNAFAHTPSNVQRDHMPTVFVFHICIRLCK